MSINCRCVFTASAAIFSGCVCGRRCKKEADICRISGQISAFIFAVLEDGAHEQKCEVWPQSDKTRGFQRGRKPPFGTQPLEQRCSVLYLLARLARKMWVSHDGHTCFKRQENGRGLNGMIKSPSVSKRRGYTKLPSLVLRGNAVLFWQRISTRSKPDAVPVAIRLPLQNKFAVEGELSLVCARPLGSISGPNAGRIKIPWSKGAFEPPHHGIPVFAYFAHFPLDNIVIAHAVHIPWYERHHVQAIGAVNKGIGCGFRATVKIEGYAGVIDIRLSYSSLHPQLWIVVFICRRRLQ